MLLLQKAIIKFIIKLKVIHNLKKIAFENKFRLNENETRLMSVDCKLIHCRIQNFK